MPPPDRLEEIGALATLVDENRFSYRLDALCAWRGLPGKDETLAAAGGRGGRLHEQQEDPPQAYIWQLPARYVGPYAEADAAPRWRSARDLTRSSTRKERAPPIGSKSTCCRWCWRCAGAVSALTRAPPSRRATIPAETRRCAGRAVGQARHAGQHARDRQPEMEGANFRRTSHRLSAHRERQSVVHGRRMDGTRSDWMPR